MAFTAIAVADVTSNTTAVTLTVPSGTSGNLMVNWKWETTSSGDIGMRFNGDTGNNYNFTTMYNYSGSAGSGYMTSQSYILVHRPSNDSDQSSTGCIYIPDSQTANKCVTAIYDGGGGSNKWTQGSGTWFNTSSRVTSITFFNQDSTSYYFRPGCSVELYGMGES
jgi:hypothetical protein